MAATRVARDMPGAVVARGDRVTLRTVESEDLPFVQRSYANPEIRHPLGSPVKTQEQLTEWTDDDESDRFLVCIDGPDAGPAQPDEGDVRRIGLVAVTDASWRRPDLVYWLVPDVHGEGYGSEAVSLAVDYTFREYDHPAVGATAYDSNDASRGLLESLGFTEEGRKRRDRFVNGAYRDTVFYGLLREEWRDD